MVRTYRPEKYHLLSPWEQAMKIADSGEGRPIPTGKRMYSDVNVSRTSLSFNGANEKVLKLPPINEDPQLMTQFLGEEVGKALYRSKEKIKKISKEFVLYDPMETGLMSKSAAIEILQRYKVPANENYRKKLAAYFIDKNEPGKINHNKLLGFLDNSRKASLERNRLLKQQEDQEEANNRQFADSYVARYDSSQNSHKSEYKARARQAMHQASAARRDAGLLLEIERVLTSYAKADPHDLIDQLDEAIRRTCKNDDFLVDNMHLKGLVDKHQFPINTALTLKCIERLDIYDNGQVEYPRFINFLRKAIANSPRSIDRARLNTSTSTNSHLSIETVPEKPAWENRQPLSGIGQMNGNSHEPNVYSVTLNNNGKDEINQQPGAERGRRGTFSIPIDDKYGNSPYNLNDEHFQNGNTSTPLHDYLAPLHDYLAPLHNYLAPPTGKSHQQDYSYEQNNEKLYNTGDDVNHTDEDSFRIADDLEAEFVSNLNKIKNERLKEAPSSVANYNPYLQGYNASPKPKPVDEDKQDYHFMGERGETYKRIADALNDKAKLTNGFITTDAVRKIVNYYNLLFDTNLPLEQMNVILGKYSSHGQVQVNQIINTFGSEIQ